MLRFQSDTFRQLHEKQKRMLNTKILGGLRFQFHFIIGIQIKSILDHIEKLGQSEIFEYINELGGSPLTSGSVVELKMTNLQMFWLSMAHLSANKVDSNAPKDIDPSATAFSKNMQVRMKKFANFRISFQCGNLTNDELEQLKHAFD